jgi:Leucine-rich repeat (LRR) protein
MEEKSDEQIAFERIAEVARQRTEKLDLSGLGLTELPKRIFELTWLEKLDLESVGLVTLSKDIGTLKNLKEINLLDNRLQELPQEFGNLELLENLNLDFNQIKHLPLEFAKLQNLSILDFSNNDIGYFPFAITKLTNLRGLYIDYNAIEYLPAEIGNLIQLEELDINANLMSSLPTEFGNLVNLKNLDLSRNEFAFLPDCLFNLANLEELYAGENHLTNINPKISKLKKLRLLNLGNSGAGLRYWSGETDYDNEISEIPFELTHLSDLEILDLTGNPLPISPEILENVKNPSLIVQTYFKDKPSPPNRRLQAFLCHSSHDKPQVRKLYKKLIDDNIDVWLDEKSLLPGQDWEYEISKAVAKSDAIIICLSNNSVSKEGFVQKEIRFALDKAEEKPEGTIFIIPALLEECEVPPRLSKRHWVKLFEKNGYNLLLKALSVRATNLGLIW